MWSHRTANGEIERNNNNNNKTTTTTKNYLNDSRRYSKYKYHVKTQTKTIQFWYSYTCNAYVNASHPPNTIKINHRNLSLNLIIAIATQHIYHTISGTIYTCKCVYASVYGVWCIVHVLGDARTLNLGICINQISESIIRTR